MKKNILLLSITFLLFIISSCDSTEPPPPNETKPTLTLALEDTSCTEAWLQLKTKDLELPAQLTLKQYNPSGDSISQIFLLNTQDSLLYIDSLLPNQNYSFQISSILYQVSSAQQPVTTMDTTSHNFTFTSWTFGTVGSSVLYDVAIINENNIWAVGEIMIADTSQNGYTTYNAVHWDGNEWELKQIPFYYNGQIFYSTVKAILVFNENDIWFGIANLIHWNGTTYQSISTSSVFPALVNKMWGTSSNDFYIVGTNGQIAHYNGSNWQLIESGTTLNINDIWGDFNDKTQEWEILAVCGNILQGWEEDRAIIRIDNINQAVQLNAVGSKWPLSGIWFKSRIKYYVIGSGIYQTNQLGETWQGNPLDITTYFVNRIRANVINDVVIVGAYGETLHFNGFTWKSFFSETSLSNGTYLSVGIHNDLITAVGYQSAQAVITVGAR